MEFFMKKMFLLFILAGTVGSVSAVKDEEGDTAKEVPYYTMDKAFPSPCVRVFSIGSHFKLAKVEKALCNEGISLYRALAVLKEENSAVNETVDRLRGEGWRFDEIVQHTPVKDALYNRFVPEEERE